MALELNRTTILSLFCSILFFSSGAVASSGVTYHGRLLKPNGQPVTSNSVQFKVQIRTPSPSLCILFEEIYTRDLSMSAGVFSLTLNDG
ncbi:MAG: hypothetical protein KF789_14765, partial [Bdellovibrionaceae bacterium]|nr:hypothetical protein [Pseudobdellovibrionaceae bacterium]